MPTLRDVAKTAGVSVGLASAVINRSASVSEHARARVKAAVTELGYVPHAVARSLRLGRTGLVGLVLPDITNPHFAGLADAIENACDEAGLVLTLSITSDDADRESRQIRLLRQQRADGLVLIPGANSVVGSGGVAAELRNAMPSATVLVDRQLPGVEADAILLDNHDAARALTAHLLTLGHRRIGIVCGPRTIALAQERLAGFRAAFRDARIPYPVDLTAHGGFKAEPAVNATLSLLDRPDPPTALLSTSNHMTLGMLRALSQRALRCPEDISIAAIDDIPFADVLLPRLTVAAQPMQSMGEAAVTRLRQRLAGGVEGPPSTLIHRATLIIRGSTRPLT